MRIIPTELGPENVTSSERRVHEALKTSALAGTTLHSLNLPEHEYKLTAELDFVLLLENLVLAVEVKGGQVSQRGGIWIYSDRSGNYRESNEGPFNQVESGMYALQKRLTNRLGKSVVDHIAFGYLVITTDVDLPSSFEWDEETYCGRGPFRRGLDAALERARRYWLNRQPKSRRIDAETMATVLNELRPDFDRSPLLDARAVVLDAAFVRLTDEQFTRLDLISDAPRVLCSGGAGTGKTLLAAEMARRKALMGMSVLFVCRSEILAAIVRAMLAGSSVQVVALSALTPRGKFDLVVVDEAQDLMNVPSLDLLERAVDGGLSNGRWVMFMDQNRQAHLYGDFDPTALEYVESLGAVPATLRVNCRNTREITFQTRAVTGADIGVAAAGSGPQVEFITLDDEAAETAALEAHLRRLRDEEVQPGSITIVSMRGDWESSAARGLRAVRKGRLQRLDATYATNWPGEQLTWSSAVDIKGLENRFVCVIDIDSLETEAELDLLYVALSRPRAGLWIAMNTVMAERISALYKEHSPGALAALKEAR